MKLLLVLLLSVSTGELSIFSRIEKKQELLLKYNHKAIYVRRNADILFTVSFVTGSGCSVPSYPTSISRVVNGEQARPYS